VAELPATLVGYRRKMTRPTIESLSAVTLFTGDMAQSVRFYSSLGFDLAFGAPDADFTSFRVGSGFLNLMVDPDGTGSRWGRIIFHVSDVDAFYGRVRDLGLDPEAPPRDAEWGERYFHIADPDGHQLSFARPLPDSDAIA
jgi:catechol 2,3-dioxygenase-like lactoylglutathione lyase family enzyme